MELAQRTRHDGQHARWRAAAADTPPLTSGEHATLLLVACGYAPNEIAGLRGVGVGDVVAELGRAVERLGAATVRGAIAAAEARGLLTWNGAAGQAAAGPHASAS